jgi:hypothetical protein
VPDPERQGHERFWAFVAATASRGNEIGEQLGAKRYDTEIFVGGLA